MTPLAVSDDAVWRETFGAEPQSEEGTGDEQVREVHLIVGATEELHVTWDTTDSSVRIRHVRDTKTILDLYREQATLLSVRPGNGSTSLVIEYAFTDAQGRTEVQVHPKVIVTDTLLLG